MDDTHHHYIIRLYRNIHLRTCKKLFLTLLGGASQHGYHTNDYIYHLEYSLPGAILQPSREVDGIIRFQQTAHRPHAVLIERTVYAHIGNVLKHLQLYLIIAVHSGHSLIIEPNRPCGVVVALQSLLLHHLTWRQEHPRPLPIGT